MKTATFIGHRECHSVNKHELERQIEILISEGAESFLFGGMGLFDFLCADVVYNLKKRYTQIHSFLVIPYLTFKVNFPEKYDEIIYPEGFERYHFKAAIVKRNRYLVDNSDVAICYMPMTSVVRQKHTCMQRKRC